MIVSFMVAMDENRVIGKDNNLPWRLPSELQYVKNNDGSSAYYGEKEL